MYVSLGPRKNPSILELKMLTTTTQHPTISHLSAQARADNLPGQGFLSGSKSYDVGNVLEHRNVQIITAQLEIDAVGLGTILILESW